MNHVPDALLDDVTDVLVVGAGPTGLTLACDLARRGIDCRLVERTSAPHPRSRGKGIQPRTLELLADLGGVDDVLAEGWSRDVRVRWHVGGRLLVELRLPGRDPQPAVPYPNLVLLPQWRTEQVLRERLAAYGGHVQFGWELEQVRQDGDGVTATVSDPSTGRRRTIRSRYLVGCDGGSSRVRKALGLAMTGSTHEERFVFGDVEIDGLDRGAAHVWFDGPRYLAASPFPGQRAWQVQASAVADADGEVEPASLELFSRLFRERTGRDDMRVSSATWLSDFVSNVRMVDRYRVGRVFLAGDAAHVHSPAGGQGMNTGMQDAYNLGWKLGLVLRGRAGDALLDTYEEERLPLARAVLKGTDVGYQIVFSRNPVVTVLRERVLVPLLQIPAVQQRVLAAGDQLDISYRGRSLARELASAPERAGLVDVLRGLRQRYQWARAPHAGDRAPDAELVHSGTGARTRLHAELRGPASTLLLFTGAGPTPEDVRLVDALADRVERMFGTDLQVRVVAPVERPGPQGPRVLVDPSGRAHRRYGAGSAALYLVRPDGYVATRCPDLDEGALLAHLHSLLGPGGGAVPVQPGRALRAAVPAR